MRYLLLALIVISSPLTGQRAVTEVVKPTSPEEDAKPVSAAVPEVYSIAASFERVLVLRFKYQADLLAGLQGIVEKHGIRNAVILAGIGSVRNYHVHSVSNREFPSKNVFVKDPTYPADVLSVNGYVINGKVHAHLTMADRDKAFGGHLEMGTNTFTFAVITLGVLGDDVPLDRADDKTYR